jgi:8-oxo-dGTP diphosphatase
MKRIRVACAVVEIGDKILVVQRSEKMKLPLKWEFPGGKIELAESPEDCILRELLEELNIKVEIANQLTSVNFDYSDSFIELIPFVVRYDSGEIRLAEHKQYLLLSKTELVNLDWSEADIPVLTEYLKL